MVGISEWSDVQQDDGTDSYHPVDTSSATHLLVYWRLCFGPQPALVSLMIIIQN